MLEEQQYQGQEEDMDVGPIKIERLQEEGINVKDIEKLQAAGLYTVEAVAYSTLKTLTAIKGITDVKAAKLIDSGATPSTTPALLHT